MPDDHIVQLPHTANVRAGRCTHCQEDLNDLLLKVRSGEAEQPQFCRHCGSRLVEPINVRILVCSHCKQELTLQPPDPDREQFCTQCRTRIEYQDISVLPKI